MSDALRGAAVIGQSGGPTAVINQSLVGVIEGIHRYLDPAGAVTKILGMDHGIGGIVDDAFFDLTDVPAARLERLAQTPSAGLGSTRAKPDAGYCERILGACERNDIRYFFYIGGNDSSDTCRLVNDLSNANGYELRCFHIPKTVDNDLMENDHAPGFPSAARFVAKACMADFLDNISLPGIKINVIMGRHAGFLTAASALARCADHRSDDLTDGPQLIYLPEVPFDTDRFVQDVGTLFDRQGRCHVAVSEGICDSDGVSIGSKLIEGGQVDAHGNVQLSGSGALGDLLSNLLKENLTPAGGSPPRVRADTFGYLQRCWPDASPVDVREARAAGRFAAELAGMGEPDGSVAIKRDSPIEKGAPYSAHFERVELSAVAGKTRHMPAEFIDGHNNVSQAFHDYCRPLVGELPVFERL